MNKMDIQISRISREQECVSNHDNEHPSSLNNTSYILHIFMRAAMQEALQRISLLSYVIAESCSLFYSLPARKTFDFSVQTQLH